MIKLKKIFYNISKVLNIYIKDKSYQTQLEKNLQDLLSGECGVHIAAGLGRLEMLKVRSLFQSPPSSSLF